ncbi:hypothetical protein Anas_07254 [Armadillidium nasatum]|uniref:Uncharacterized protein n=1 Tax=Armadillidium nasatum TaxID=96803 RepID=A0A5N5STG0_9CRUS|nr:hypothetical protein Anas_07254 [Armadillidium nasatum]
MSPSGLTRRYNQLVQLIWETSRDMCLSEAQRERSVSKLIKKNSIHLPEDYVKELTWDNRKRSCLSQFMFKLCMGNQNPNFDSYLSTQTRPVVPEKLENLYIPEPGSPLNFVDRPLKQTVFIYRCEGCIEDQVNGEDGYEDLKKRSGKSRKYQYNILTTCYCYYAPIGMVSCLFASVLFAVISGKCKISRVHPKSLELLHPYVKKKYSNLPGATGPTRSPPSSPAPQRKKKINALTFLQETANI